MKHTNEAAATLESCIDRMLHAFEDLRMRLHQVLPVGHPFFQLDQGIGDLLDMLGGCTCETSTQAVTEAIVALYKRMLPYADLPLDKCTTELASACRFSIKRVNSITALLHLRDRN